MELYLISLGTIVSFAGVVFGVGIVLSLPQLLEDSDGPLQFLLVTLFGVGLSAGSLYFFLVLMMSLTRIWGAS